MWFVPIALAILASSPEAAIAEESEEEQDELDGLTDQEKKALRDLDLSTVVIRAKRLDPTEESTAFAETLDVKDGVTRLQSVSEVLSDAVGVQVRSLGGLGSYGVASIRGSTPNQVPVYLDGVLLNAGGFDSVNLGDLSLDLLERIEVFRGATPAHLGTAGIGGALHLKTREFKDSLTEAAVSAGSWNTYRVFALHGQRFDALETKLLAILSLSGSEGDFAYFNYNGTRFNPDDDRIQPRRNNEHLSLNGLLKLDGTLGAWRWTLVENIHSKDQGVAGIDSIPTEFTNLISVRNALTARAVLPFASGLKLSPQISYLFLFEDFDDSRTPHGETGLGKRHTIAATHAVSGGALVEYQPAQDHYSTARLDMSWELFTHREEVERVEYGPKSRLRTAVALQHEWNIIDDLFALPAARLEWQHNSISGGPLPNRVEEIEAIESDDFFWQASLGARWEFLPGLSARANAGRYVRTPTLGEMFGDRGSVIGNPDLKPETGINADTGLTWTLAGRGPLSLLRAEVAWFGTWSEDLIVFWQNSQDTVRADNISAAEILGLETSLRVVLWDLVAFACNYTFLHAVNRSDTTFYTGKKLPGRPAHEVYGKIELGHTGVQFEAQLWADVDYADRNFFDPFNDKDAGARLLVGAGLRLGAVEKGLTVTVQVKNLLDTISVINRDGYRLPLQDFEAFPMPGRTVMATVFWRH